MSTDKRLMDFETKKSRVPNLPVIIGGLLLCLMGAMVLHGWSQTNSFAPAIQVLLGTAEGGAAGEVINQGDITLYIPPNATGQQGTFSIAEANLDVTLISNDTQWIRPKVVNLEFRQPNGAPLSDISFDEPLEICFSLGNEQWQAFLAQPAAFEVQHYLDDADPPYWEVLPQTSYAERQQLCGEIDELSAFALAIKVEAQVPVTGPTAASTGTTPVPTRTLIPPQATRTRNRDGASSGSSLSSGPTSTATSTPRPTNTQPPPTPTRTPTRTPTDVLPTDPPPTATRMPTRTPTATHTEPPPPPPTATDEPDPTSEPDPTETPGEDPGGGL